MSFNLHINRKNNNALANVSRNAKKEFGKGLAKMAISISNDAKSSIARGAKTGKIYKRKNITHQASAPGQAPATDTGNLISNINVDTSEQTNFIYYVISRAPYSKVLEYGGSKMAPRPFLHPAVVRNKDKIKDIKNILHNSLLKEQR